MKTTSEGSWPAWPGLLSAVGLFYGTWSLAEAAREQAREAGHGFVIVDSFVTYDKRLLSSAEAAGLSTRSPGADN
jgi:hypothetical protein